MRRAALYALPLLLATPAGAGPLAGLASGGVAGAKIAAPPAEPTGGLVLNPPAGRASTA
jgi:hypothetical protein